MNRHLSTKVFVISNLLILIIGLIFIYGLYYFVNLDTLKNASNEYNPVTQEPISFNLTVSTPEDNTLSFDKNIVVSGKTSPDTTVIISVNDSISGFGTGVKEDFSKIINLTAGKNIINITAFDPQGNTKTEIRSVFYSEEKL